MKPNYTDITIILDRSGSMKHKAGATLAGLNEFIEEQRVLPGEVTLTLIQFNHRRSVAFDAIPIRETVALKPTDYRPGGSTALLDAVAVTIDETGQRLGALAEHDRPSKVIVTILTDGLENASRRFTYQQVAGQIRNQEEVYKWEFLFLGANQDAIAEAAKLAIDHRAALTFRDSADGSLAAFKSLSKAVGDARTGKKPKAGFDEPDRQNQQPPENPPTVGDTGKK